MGHLFITIESHRLCFYRGNDLVSSVRLALDLFTDTTSSSTAPQAGTAWVRWSLLLADLGPIMRTHDWDDAMCSSSVDDYALDHGWPWGMGKGVRTLLEDAYEAR